MTSLENVVASRPASKLLSVHRYFCDDNECRMTKGQQLLFRDRNHLNINGSRLAGTRLVADNPDLFPRRAPSIGLDLQGVPEKARFPPN